ncbi:hypothetical protein CEP54_012293 [Fusarium duplospermum]|uniref:Uncharacterized protein n=1 Tax=Fusarium duplospermum TaxID=1325734 RepID=A0A428P9M1_9HYPO|nr:hypothetical protein CEP54_012293 [Fusarium duplospermum]
MILFGLLALILFYIFKVRGTEVRSTKQTFSDNRPPGDNWPFSHAGTGPVPSEPRANRTRSKAPRDYGEHGIPTARCFMARAGDIASDDEDDDVSYHYERAEEDRGSYHYPKDEYHFYEDDDTQQEIDYPEDPGDDEESENYWAWGFSYSDWW